MADNWYTIDGKAWGPFTDEEREELESCARRPIVWHKLDYCARRPIVWHKSVSAPSPVPIDWEEDRGHS